MMKLSDRTETSELLNFLLSKKDDISDFLFKELLGRMDSVQYRINQLRNENLLLQNKNNGFEKQINEYKKGLVNVQDSLNKITSKPSLIIAKEENNKLRL